MVLVLTLGLGYATSVVVYAPTWALRFGATGWLLGVSTVAALVYRLDKHRAGRPDAWRVPEDALCKLALWGGWPGALLVVVGYRHKLSKLTFRRRFVESVGLNLAVTAGAVLVARMYAAQP